MKNNLKSGFTLAETLLAIGIISVVATIGFSFAQKGIERAYNQYYFTGYEGISLAIQDAEAQGRGIHDTNSFDIRNDFLTHIADLFGVRDFDADNACENENIGSNDVRVCTIIAPNKISYQIFLDGQREEDTDGDGNDEDLPNYTIRMDVPAPKQADGNTFSRVCLAYLPYDTYGKNANEGGAPLLIPFQGTTPSAPDQDPSCSSSVDIVNRTDLLPFYLDDGEVGRVVGGIYRPIEVTTISDALRAVFKAYNTANPTTTDGQPDPTYGVINGQVIFAENCLDNNEHGNKTIRYISPLKAFRQ